MISSSSSTVSDEDNNQIIDSLIGQIESKNENDEEILQCRTSKLTDENNNQQQRLNKRQALWIGKIKILIDNFTETYSNITYSYTEVIHS